MSVICTLTCDNETDRRSAGHASTVLTTTANLTKAGALMADAQPIPCTIPDCGRRTHNRNRHCPMHIWRRKHYGSVDREPPTALERFRSSYVEDPESGCWLWRRTVLPETGYARFSVGGRGYRAHKWGYEQLVGSVPEDLVLDHLCRVRHCVRPSHLEPVTPRVNVVRGMSEPAVIHRREICRRGHEVGGDNLYIPPGKPGQRACVECRRINAREYRARKAAR